MSGFVSVAMSYQYIYSLGLPIVSSIVIVIIENTNKLHFFAGQLIWGLHLVWPLHFTCHSLQYSSALKRWVTHMSCGYTCPVQYSCVCLIVFILFFAKQVVKYILLYMVAVFCSSLYIHHYMYVFMIEPLIGVVFSSVTWAHTNFSSVTWCRSLLLFVYNVCKTWWVKKKIRKKKERKKSPQIKSSISILNFDHWPKNPECWPLDHRAIPEMGLELSTCCMHVQSTCAIKHVSFFKTEKIVR